MEVVELFETYGSPSYPLDVFSLAGRMGVAPRSYSSIPINERNLSKKASDDAFTLSKGNYSVGTTFICFNQDMNKGRMRQSVAHEIAHIWLDHPNNEEPFETEAEYFAAYLLAPIPIIITNKLETISEIKNYFNISFDAARIALERMTNRRSCKKPAYPYEHRIIEMVSSKGGDDLALD